MVRRTYGQVKSQLARVAAQTGLKTSDARLLARVNEALELIMESNTLPLITDRIQSTITSSRVVLPFDQERILEASIDNIPIQVKSPWFEFMEVGQVFVRPKEWKDTRNVLLERGETPLQVLVPNEDTDPDYQIVVKGFGDEVTNATVTPVVIIKGYDENGEWIRTDTGSDNWIDGEQVTMVAGSPYEATTTKYFSEITEVIKPVTFQHIKLIARPSAGDDVELADYKHNETYPSFRVYDIPNVIDGQSYSLDIRVKARFQDIVNDDDLMPISNIQALKFMMIAVHKGDVQKTGDYWQNYNAAKQMLEEEAISYRGKSKSNPVSFKNGLTVGGFSGF